MAMGQIWGTKWTTKSIGVLNHRHIVDAENNKGFSIARSPTTQSIRTGVRPSAWPHQPPASSSSRPFLSWFYSHGPESPVGHGFKDTTPKRQHSHLPTFGAAGVAGTWPADASALPLGCVDLSVSNGLSLSLSCWIWTPDYKILKRQGGWV